MNIGAIAMLDALGFKGIWQRHDAEAVLDQLRELREALGRLETRATADLAKNLVGEGKLTEAPRASVRFLSDTIVAAFHMRGFSDDDNPAIRATISAAMVAYTVHVSIHIASAMAHTENRAPLNYRGAVTWGEFLIDENFLVGPAVDRAAELHNRSDGAFIEIDGSAMDLFHRASRSPFPADLSPNRLALEHDVPIKGACDQPGSVGRCWVANPFGTCSNADQMLGVMDGMKRAFGDDPFTKQPTKYRATLDLLTAARRAWEVRERGMFG